MKPTMALKPLVFALAAVMAMAAQAGGNDHGNGHGNGHGNHGPKGPTLEQLLQIGAGAGAAALSVALLSRTFRPGNGLVTGDTRI